jgi:hypothetical protein
VRAQQRTPDLTEKPHAKHGTEASVTRANRVLDIVLGNAAASPAYRRGIDILQTRSREFSSTIQMQFAGIALGPPEGRRMFDTALDQAWAGGGLPARTGEVIIGGGFHAAVYCAARVLAGFPAPLVLESARAGGCFAVSDRPSFYLNSRNRPGLISLPGEGRGLNFLPGAPVQPADISGDEYGVNTDIAFVIRAALAMYGDVITQAEVTALDEQDNGYVRVMVRDRGSVLCQRVIDARGLGEPAYPQNARPDGKIILSAPQWMASMDSDFPLQGMKRVAVGGSGDYARCTVESLTGLGPGGHMSTAGLDYVESIDWFAPGLVRNCIDWRTSERTRYQRLGGLLRDERRLKLIQNPARVTRSAGSVIVNGNTYDHLIMAIGWQRPRIPGLPDFNVRIGTNPEIAAQAQGRPYYAIGPAADIPLSTAETNRGLPAASRVAMFRLASRTAALAVKLPAAAAA